ncbi:hypothetical protein FJZ18_02800 [Candidatus Pacearchaeota archaeon]|nr:hypothetical protein [Candidatus Pacearchaeota archaeon]
MKGFLAFDDLTAYSLILMCSTIRNDPREYRLIKKTIQSLEYHYNRFKRIISDRHDLPKNRYGKSFTDAIMNFYSVPKNALTNMSPKETTYQASIGLEMIISELHEAEEERKKNTIQEERAATLIEFFRILSEKIMSREIHSQNS